MLQTFMPMQMQRQRVLRYPKKFTVKAWKKFDLTQQDILCCRYDIILTDYKTRKEKIFSVMDKFSPKNIDKGIKVMNKGLSQFSKTIDELDKGLNQSMGSKKKRDYRFLGSDK